MSAPRTVARSRVVGAVLAILLVTVAGIGERLSDPASSTAYASSDLLRAPLDQTVDYQTGALRVSDVRVGSQIVDGDDGFSTKGLFVAVNVTVQATARDGVRVSDSRLLTDDGVTYLPAFSLGSTVTADPGFATTQDLVFEVDPSRISGLTLELWSSGVTYRYYDRTQTPLGITSANAGQWAQAGTDRSIGVVRRGTTEAIA